MPIPYVLIERRLNQGGSLNAYSDELAPVAVHCEAGLGRTGTMIAVYLVLKGESPDSAIASVRSAESGAIETGVQIRFLQLSPPLLQLSLSH